jgi:hypothetical protein
MTALVSIIAIMSAQAMQAMSSNEAKAKELEDGIVKFTLINRAVGFEKEGFPGRSRSILKHIQYPITQDLKQNLLDAYNDVGEKVHNLGKQFTSAQYDIISDKALSRVRDEMVTIMQKEENQYSHLLK